MEFDDINTVAVLGAGNMGHGIAEVAAMAGYDVTMRDVTEEFVQDGYEQIEWSLNKLAENEQIGEDEAEAALARVETYVDFEDAVADADVVIEAVPEKMEIKEDVYGELSAYVPDHAVFASNTSSISITDLSETTDRPEQFCGMHFFNPPVRMQLVEVISGDHTADWVLDVTEALAEAFDKTPVRVRKDSPGFVVNRVAVPLMNEVAWLVHEGEATIAEVDSTTKHDMGLPMGSFELADYVGIDVSYDVLTYVESVLGETYEPCPLLEEKVEAEELGTKTDEGFYDYEDGGVEIPMNEGREDVEAILVAMQANEVAKLVGEDVADPGEIDEAVMLGLGYPQGPATMADEYGLDELVETLERRHEETGHPRYEVAGYLREAADAGGFYGGGEEGGERFDYEVIDVSVDGHVVHVEVDRAHRMNTITPGMLEELDDAFDAIQDDELDVRAVLLTGAGDRAFSAGFDASTASVGSGIEAAEMSRYGQQVFGKLEELPMPVLAAIDGYTLGGGMELATCADVRIATERSSFGQPEHDLGLLPGWGGTQRLKHVVGEGRAKEIIFTARNDYDPETMYDYGFVNEVVDNDDFEDRAWEFARDLAAGPPIAQKFTKRAMLAGRDDTGAGLEVEASAFGHLFETDDVWEGLAAFQQDREPEFEGK
jgi:enoyl-CoA hydratase/3-hydroxyacyl-CoA dehydrogenase